MTAIPKPMRDRLAERSGGICERCGIKPATNFHHRKNRSQGGGNELSNAMHLCGSGTTGCHGHITENPKEAYHFGWSVRSGFAPAEVPVWRNWQWVLLTDEGTVFVPPAGPGRCELCGCHTSQGHRDGCQRGGENAF